MPYQIKKIEDELVLFLDGNNLPGLILNQPMARFLAGKDAERLNDGDMLYVNSIVLG